jgi:hypothetical protein
MRISVNRHCLRNILRSSFIVGKQGTFHQNDDLSGDTFDDAGQRKTQGRLDGRLKKWTNGAGETVPDNLYRVRRWQAELHFFGGLQQGQDMGVKADEIAADTFAGDGVGSGEEIAQLAGPAVDGALACHGNDGVDESQHGGQFAIDSDNQAAEVVFVMAFGEMPVVFFFAAETADAAIHVFEGEGGAELLLRLELGDVDDGVGLKGHAA